MYLDKTHNNVCIDKHSSDTFPIQNAPKQGDVLPPIPFSLTSEYAIKKIQGNQVWRKMNGIYELLVYADDINPSGDNINTVNKKKQKI
jgi:hypothetical protein